MPTIRVDQEVYETLQDMAEPLRDRPNTVLRRVLDLDAQTLDPKPRSLSMQEVERRLGYKVLLTEGG